jgi:hypothetical protein
VSADLEWRSCTDDLNIAESKVSALEQRAEELSTRIGIFMFSTIPTSLLTLCIHLDGWCARFGL